jgi:hypothetical protein
LGVRVPSGSLFNIQRKTKSCKSIDLQLFLFLARSSKSIKKQNDGEQTGEQIFFVNLFTSTATNHWFIVYYKDVHFILSDDF